MSKHRARLLVLAAMALSAVAVFAPAAQGAKPAEPYARFAGCPDEDPAIAACVRSVVNSGNFQMGSKSVPITNPITITGGLNSTLGGFTANSEGGMQPVKQLVPGGLIGLTGLDWLVNFLNVEQLKLYAVTELVGPPVISNSLSLPIRVHLINPALGSKCYVGSTAKPIELSLIYGTTSPPPPNEPITGVTPTFSFDEPSGVLKFANGTYVDNSFAAPGASGCVLNVLGLLPIGLDGIVNGVSGLPAAAGTNETTQNIDIEIAPVERVYP
jgi:hypothetical protein